MYVHALQDAPAQVNNINTNAWTRMPGAFSKPSTDERQLECHGNDTNYAAPIAGLTHQQMQDETCLTTEQVSVASVLHLDERDQFTAYLQSYTASATVAFQHAPSTTAEPCIVQGQQGVEYLGLQPHSVRPSACPGRGSCHPGLC